MGTLWIVRFRRLTLRSATGTAQRHLGDTLKGGHRAAKKAELTRGRGCYGSPPLMGLADAF